MKPVEQRAALLALIEEQGRTLAELSSLLGRNAAYLQQYLRRGTPRLLAEEDRGRLARLLGVSDAHLGGPAASGVIEVSRLDIDQAAGLGGISEEAPSARTRMFPPAMLRQLGVRPQAASMISVQGNSMAPLLEHGDELLIDLDARIPSGRGGVYALRLEGALVVKRLRTAVGGIEVVSDNPAYPTRVMPRAAVEIVGRVAWLGRAL